MEMLSLKSSIPKASTSPSGPVCRLRSALQVQAVMNSVSASLFYQDSQISLASQLSLAHVSNFLVRQRRMKGSYIPFLTFFSISLLNLWLVHHSHQLGLQALASRAVDFLFYFLPKVLLLLTVLTGMDFPFCPNWVSLPWQGSCCFSWFTQFWPYHRTKWGEVADVDGGSPNQKRWRFLLLYPKFLGFFFSWINTFQFFIYLCFSQFSEHWYGFVGFFFKQVYVFCWGEYQLISSLRYS